MKYSSSLNLVHDPNTGKGNGRTLSGSFSLKDIFSPSKTSLTETETPEVGMQLSHSVGKPLRRPRLVEADGILGPTSIYAVALCRDLPLVNRMALFGVLRPESNAHGEIEDDSFPGAGVQVRVELTEGTALQLLDYPLFVCLGNLGAVRVATGHRRPSQRERH